MILLPSQHSYGPITDVARCNWSKNCRVNWSKQILIFLSISVFRSSKGNTASRQNIYQVNMILFGWFLGIPHPAIFDSFTKSTQLQGHNWLGKVKLNQLLQGELIQTDINLSVYLCFQFKQGESSIKTKHQSGKYDFIWVIHRDCLPCNIWFFYQVNSVTGP